LGTIRIEIMQITAPIVWHFHSNAIGELHKFGVLYVYKHSWVQNNRSGQPAIIIKIYLIKLMTKLKKSYSKYANDF